jgi:hypothetical protein
MEKITDIYSIARVSPMMHPLSSGRILFPFPTSISSHVPPIPLSEPRPLSSASDLRFPHASDFANSSASVSPNLFPVDVSPIAGEIAIVLRDSSTAAIMSSGPADAIIAAIKKSRRKVAILPTAKWESTGMRGKHGPLNFESFSEKVRNSELFQAVLPSF